jgi:hypothetical protein
MYLKQDERESKLSGLKQANSWFGIGFALIETGNK